MAEKRARRRTGAERRAHRESLLRAAAETLLKLGLRDAKMDDIAEHAGITKVILYRHFASKEDLIHTILEREAERLLEIDRRPYEGGEKRARELLDAARENLSSFVLLIRDARNDPVYGEHTKRVREAIFVRLAAAFKRRHLDERFASLSADAIVTLVLESTLYWLENGAAQDDERFIAWYAASARSLDYGWRQVLAPETLTTIPVEAEPKPVQSATRRNNHP